MKFGLLVEKNIGLSILQRERIDLPAIAVVILVPFLIQVVASERRIVASVCATVVANHRAQVVLSYFVFTVLHINHIKLSLYTTTNKLYPDINLPLCTNGCMLRLSIGKDM